LHGIVDGETDSTPPVGMLLERGRRARRRRTSAVAGSTLAVLVLAALGVAAVAHPGSTAPDVTAGASSAQAPSPDMKLASAFATSKDISYRMRLTTEEFVYQGAFDPVTDTGYFQVETDRRPAPRDIAWAAELLIKGTRYISGEQYSGKHDHMSLYVLASVAPDPAALYAVFQKTNATVTENSDGSLHYALTIADQAGSNAVSGDVTLDADGRIGKVTLTNNWRSTAKDASGTTTATLELFDYGVDVKVKRPADVPVK
jgi:hypothetical protein